MSSKRGRGFTLIETVMAIAIIGVGLAGLMTAFSNTSRTTADPVVRKQLLSVAEEIMEEIQLKPYAPNAPTAGAGCARKAYNDILDYDNYTTTGFICDMDGTQIAMLAGYKLEIDVSDADEALDTAAIARKITVTVTYGKEVVKLVGWRTAYAL